MPDPIEGGCLCGACRYTSTGEILNIRACHCHRCQKATGAAFYARVMVPLESVAMSGPVGWCGSDGDVRRGFCQNCGTSLFSERQSAGTVGLSMGSIDTPDRYAPQEHIWTSSKQEWLRLDDGKPQYAKGPPV
ncbi:GFA family protein [Altererythrobacter indicus]|uniref:GFA family protein n=2 Tax=Altericroceibacterium indicum TaxID=374177 RepID=A0A845A4L6_9SPHN|nr:GFA family protein [Altericroceibacterium indicum]